MQSPESKALQACECRPQKQGKEATSLTWAATASVSRCGSSTLIPMHFKLCITCSGTAFQGHAGIRCSHLT